MRLSSVARRSGRGTGSLPMCALAVLHSEVREGRSLRRQGKFTTVNPSAKALTASETIVMSGRVQMSRTIPNVRPRARLTSGCLLGDSPKWVWNASCIMLTAHQVSSVGAYHHDATVHAPKTLVDMPILQYELFNDVVVHESSLGAMPSHSAPTTIPAQRGMRTVGSISHRDCSVRTSASTRSEHRYLLEGV